MFEVVTRDMDGVEAVVATFDNPKDAGTLAKEHRASPNVKSAFIRKVASDDSWKAREQSRFDSGEYRPLPWAHEPWVVADHFAHVSTKDAAKIAYTPNVGAGVADRQVQIKPGRYLAEIYPPVEQTDSYLRTSHLTNERNCAIRALAMDYASRFETIEVKFAKTADDIEHVYCNGPDSCMSHDLDYYKSSVHPVRVYAAGDLAIAYLREDEDITARVVCWPAKKVYSRIYGDEDRLVTGLVKLGYEHAPDKLAGAKLLKIQDRNGFVMPYLDDSLEVNDAGEHFVITHSGDYSAQWTNGLMDDNTSRCAQCDERVPDDGTIPVDGQYICDECFRADYFFCDNCGDPTHNENSVLVDENDWCEYCASRHTRECCGCDERFHNRDLIEIDGESYCESCAEKLDDDEQDFSTETYDQAHNDNRQWDRERRVEDPSLDPYFRADWPRWEDCHWEFIYQQANRENAEFDAAVWARIMANHNDLFEVAA